MVDRDRRISVLQAQRQGLLNQLAALDKAIAALDATPPSANAHAQVVTRVKPRRTLGESHQEALTKGRRKAREAKDVAAGLAREMPDESFVPALAQRSGSQSPRLVKRGRRFGKRS